MKKLTLLFQKKKALLLPSAIVVGVLIVAGGISFAFSPKSPLVAKQSETTSKIVSYNTKPTQMLLPTPLVTGSQTVAVLGSKTAIASPTVTKAVSQSSITQTESVATHTVQASVVATNTPVPTQKAPTQTPDSQTISVEINSPDGTSSFSVDYTDGMNVCDILQKAKDNGKLKSVTFDDSYMASLHSRYVSEINGFANNWIFSINGASPLGCSLSQPKPNDKIVWKFG